MNPVAQPADSDAAAAGVRARRRAQERALRWGSVWSALLLHALLAALLLLQASGASRSGAAPRAFHAIVITLAPPSVATIPTPPATPPQPIEPPKLPRMTAPDGQLPAPAKPRPPRPPKPAAKTSAAQQSSAASAASAANAAPPTPAETESDSLLGRIHDNWLPPASIPKSFRCLIRIDYRAGGFITAVKYEQGCGGALLDDSVERAIWKTQPLKIESAQNAAGSIVVEFTP